jgi:surface polysaccharide O-acyltransferase-like enzyme
MNTQFDNAFSQKLIKISFFLMVLVVFIHSYNLGYSNSVLKNDINLNHFVQNFISQGIARIAVPLFFFISGVLYFYKFEMSWKSYYNKLKKRLNTLVLPYLIWSIVGILFYLFLQLNPFTAKFFSDSSELIIKYSFVKLLDTIFIHPIPYQFWFIRDLFVLILIAPVGIMLNKYLKGYWILLLIFAYIFNLSTVIVSTGSLLFFFLGGFIVANKFKFLKKKISFKLTLFLTVLWISFYFLRASGTLNYLGYYLEISHKVFIIIGILSIWTMYDYIFSNVQETNLNPIFKTTFFLFAIHEPLLTFFRKFLLIKFGTNELQLLIVYFLCPVIIIAISTFSSMLLKKAFPKIYLISTGGR